MKTFSSAARAESPGQKRFRAGTHRLVPPEETLERIRGLLPTLGVTRIADVTGLDVVGIPVYQVYRPNGRSLSVSQGKGLDPCAARVSGIMEALESYHAERILRPLVRASWADLVHDRPVVDVEALPQTTVGAFHAHKRLLWTEGFDLMGDAPVWVPFEMVHTDYTIPLPTGSGSFIMSSVGLASGNHLLEAVSHGICEVVEQDATTRWLVSPSERRDERLVDLATLEDSDCRECIDRFAAADVAVGLWDITSDVGIPTFVCQIVEQESGWSRQLYANRGMGCHPVAEIAALRALTEAAQSRLTFIAGARDDIDREQFERSQDQTLVERVRAEVHARPHRHFSDTSSFRGQTFAEDLEWELERLEAVGVRQVVAVDLTRESIGVPVVRVLVPGLEPVFEASGFQPGPRARAAMRGAV